MSRLARNLNWRRRNERRRETRKNNNASLKQMRLRTHGTCHDLLQIKNGRCEYCLTCVLSHFFPSGRILSRDFSNTRRNIKFAEEIFAVLIFFLQMDNFEQENNCEPRILSRYFLTRVEANMKFADEILAVRIFPRRIGK